MALCVVACHDGNGPCTIAHEEKTRRFVAVRARSKSLRGYVPAAMVAARALGAGDCQRYRPGKRAFDRFPLQLVSLCHNLAG